MDEKSLDLVWTAKWIGKELGTTEAQTHYLLEKGLIRCAYKVGERWVCDRRDLRREFSKPGAP
jgi:hypothetical protein